MKSMILAGAVLGAASALAFACGGKIDSSTVDTAQGGAAGGTTGGSTGDRAPSAGTAGSGSTAPGSDCTYVSGGGSGGGGSGTYSCMTSHGYTCSSGYRELRCECRDKVKRPPKGTCTCITKTDKTGSGTAFPFDCTNGCSPTAAEFAKCGVPVPPEDGPGGGSSSSTSSGG